jgi:imidazolonepropionase-like amidohydrolase
VIDAEGGLIIPGLINIQVHGVTFGPLFPEGWKPIPEERVIANLDRHLLQGTTTALSNDGFALPIEVENVNKVHPINLKTCTLHSPKNLVLAEAAGGGDGLTKYHRDYTAAEAVASGAVAIGEVGSIGTSFGTTEKSRRLGVEVSAPDALALNDAVEANDEARLRDVLQRIGTDITVDAARKLVYDTSVFPVQASRGAVTETIELSKKLGVPALVHTTNYTWEAEAQVSRELGPRLIALHVNYTFTPEEAVRVARELRRNGSRVEVISLDAFGAKQLDKTPDLTFALLKEGLVDIISTDYIGGYHDAILLVIRKAIEENLVTLPGAIRMATSAPAEYIPGLAPRRGLIKEGYIADITIVDRDDISKVRHVLIGGRVVVEDGQIVGAARA